MIESPDLEKIFRRHALNFFGADAYVNNNLQLKLEHSLRVRDEALYLANGIDWDSGGRDLAEITGLFHDMGRFPQFARYRTYNDRASEDHACLGVAYLQQHGILSFLPAQDRETVFTAITHHGALKLPPGLADDALQLLRLIRDADKIDIYHVARTKLSSYVEDPDNFAYEVGWKHTPGCNPAVLAAIGRGQIVSFADVHNLNDVALLRLSWVFDINFPAALRRIVERGFLDEIAAFLPDSPEIKQAVSACLDHVNHHLRQTPAQP